MRSFLFSVAAIVAWSAPAAAADMPARPYIRPLLRRSITGAASMAA